jgi:hypothetical protein
LNEDKVIERQIRRFYTVLTSHLCRVGGGTARGEGPDEGNIRFAILLIGSSGSWFSGKRTSICVVNMLLALESTRDA